MLMSGSRGPNEGTFTAGYNRLRATHPALVRTDLSAHAKLLQLGTRLWREGRVLTTELKRLTAVGAPVALRLGAAPALDASRTASALWWV